MLTFSLISGHSERSQARSRAHSNLNSNLNSKMGRASNNYNSSHNLPLGGRSNLSVNNFPTLPPLPSMPPGMSSLSNYSLSRAPGSNLNNSNYYHLGSRLGDRLTGGTGNYHLMDNNPYNTTLSVPLAQGLTTTGYNGARVSGTQLIRDTNHLYSISISDWIGVESKKLSGYGLKLFLLYLNLNL